MALLLSLTVISRQGLTFDPRLDWNSLCCAEWLQTAVLQSKLSECCGYVHYAILPHFFLKKKLAILKHGGRQWRFRTRPWLGSVSVVNKSNSFSKVLKLAWKLSSFKRKEWKYYLTYNFTLFLFLTYWEIFVHQKPATSLLVRLKAHNGTEYIKR